MKVSKLPLIASVLVLAGTTAAPALEQPPPSAKAFRTTAVVKKPKARKLYDAIVNSNGALLGGSASASFRLSKGQYEVDYSVDVTKCSYTATVDGFPFGIAVAPRTGVPNGVYIAIVYPQDGDFVDIKFYLHTAC